MAHSVVICPLQLRGKISDAVLLGIEATRRLACAHRLVLTPQFNRPSRAKTESEPELQSMRIDIDVNTLRSRSGVREAIFGHKPDYLI